MSPLLGLELESRKASVHNYTIYINALFFFFFLFLNHVFGIGYEQAYTNELELEVAHLMEENSKLKKQQEQVFIHILK